MFSVVIPAYNAEKTIIEAISSVEKQTRYDLINEIIVVNDGSTDNTETVIIDYSKSNQFSKIVYLYQNNRGASAARNKGIAKAKSDWIALLDADDLWKPSKIEDQYCAILNNSRIEFLGAYYPIPFGEKENGIVKLNAKHLCIKSMPYTPSVVFKREIGIELGLFNENMKYCEDANFFQKFLLKDSYYLIEKELVTIDIGKQFFAEKGMSSALKEMFEGKKHNMRELQEMGLISKPFLYSMLLLCDIKYCRRVLLRKVKKLWIGV